MSKSKKNVVNPSSIIMIMEQTQQDGLCCQTLHQKEIWSGQMLVWLRLHKFINKIWDLVKNKKL